jgi:hypothetical protein
MTQDNSRNLVYEAAIAVTAASLQKLPIQQQVWVDVGCGASAFLTKMVLAHGLKCAVCALVSPALAA